MKFLRYNFATCTAILFALTVLSLVFFTHFDVFSIALQSMARFEKGETDEVLIVILILVSAVIIDQMRARSRESRRVDLDEQRLRVLKATMRTVQDLVGNFLNNLQLFRMEAENGPLSPESLMLFDDLIFQTADKLTELGNLEVVHEVSMATGFGVQTKDSSAV